MKHVKHCLFAAITVLLLMVAFGGSAFAHTITINPGTQPTTGHEYKAYQIFTGTYQDNDKKMTVTGWPENSGNFGIKVVQGIKNHQNEFSEAVKTKLNTTPLKEANDEESAGLVANAIDTIGYNDEDAKLFAKIVKDSIDTTNNQPPAISFTFNSNNKNYTANVDTGYYLIVDSTTSTSGVQNDFVSDPILTMVGKDGTLEAKGNVPTVEKKVKENSKNNWQDAADYNIGDTVPFQLTGTLPSNFDQYQEYRYVFTDTCSSGLTPDLTSVKVYVESANVKTELKNSTENTIYTVSGINTTDNSFTVTFENLKASGLNISKDSKIIVEYNATLNNNAVIGTSGTNAGNPNTVTLTYSNNPTAAGEGVTPPDVVYVFTYELDVSKVNKANHNDPAPGAEFVLYSDAKKKYAKVENNKVTEWVERNQATTLTSGQYGKFIVYGLDAGTYTLTETKAPDNYVQPTQATANTTFTISASPKESLDGTDANASDAITSLKIDNSSDSKDTGIVNLTIENTREGALPSTGSMGMFIMIGVGICLMAGAGIYLLKNRNKA